jgi:DNA polymerase-4
MKSRIIMHIDMDAFFAAIEQRDKPWLKGKPIAVAGIPDSRSVVATASYEARKFGVHSAMPVKIAKRLCPHLIIVKTDMEKYQKISRELVNIFNKFCPSVEQFSIDEAFLDLTYTVKTFDEAKKLAVNLKNTVKRNLRLPLTAGISYNKLLAKLASKLGKPDGLKVITPDNAESVLHDLPVSAISGIGKRTEELLNDTYNVRTLGELKKIPLMDLVVTFHSYALFLYNAARGIDNTKVIPDYEKGNPKSISNSITLHTDTDNEKYIKSTLKYLSEKVGIRIRAHKLYARTITIVIRYADFSTITHQKSIAPINGNYEIYIHALMLFKEVWNGKKVRLLGIALSNFTKDIERTLFENKNNTSALEYALDSVQIRFGNRAANYGSVMLIKNKHMI